VLTYASVDSTCIDGMRASAALSKASFPSAQLFASPTTATVRAWSFCARASVVRVPLSFRSSQVQLASPQWSRYLLIRLVGLTQVFSLDPSVPLLCGVSRGGGGGGDGGGCATHRAQQRFSFADHCP
jgi:hypothetical protein